MGATSRYEVGAVVGGKLKIVRTLGTGGMGAVYEVQHTLTHHRRALKVLRVDREKNGEATVRLLREASAAGRIGSPHIVETFDAGTLDNGDPYVVMELLDGHSFGDYLKQKRTLSLAEIATLVRQACAALQAAHDVGIVHRDVKPANLFVVQKDGRPFVKVLDFGVSKFDTAATESTELTRDGALIGTPSYMAPEQMRGETDVDARIDVYAIGILLYVASTGHRPYVGASVADLAIKIDRGSYRPMRELRPELPEAFAAVVARAMHRDRNQRYSSMQELGDALLPFETESTSGSGPMAASLGSIRPAGDVSRSDAVDSVARLEQQPNPWSTGGSGSGPALPTSAPKIIGGPSDAVDVVEPSQAQTLGGAGVDLLFELDAPSSDGQTAIYAPRPRSRRQRALVAAAAALVVAAAAAVLGVVRFGARSRHVETAVSAVAPTSSASALALAPMAEPSSSAAPSASYAPFASSAPSTPPTASASASGALPPRTSPVTRSPATLGTKSHGAAELNRTNPY